MSQTLNVHVRVTDAATARPTPVRIRIAGSNGEYYPPLGRAKEFPIGRAEDVGGHLYLDGNRYAYINGECEVPLPTGVPLSIEISKGPLYLPIRQTIPLGDGQLTLRYEIRQWADEGWRSNEFVDTRCHFLPPHAAKLEAAAEGLDLVHLLARVHDSPSQDGHMYRAIPNIIAFSGQHPALEGVYVNTFNVHPALGRLGLLNCHRAVYPLTFGYIDDSDDWSLADWCDQCHRKNGLVVWADAYRPEAGLPGGEALVNAILGRVDAIEIDARDRTTPFLPLWYRLLNAGVRLPIVGGSGKDGNRIALGAVRTMTPTTGTRSHAEWIANVRTGRTVAGNGPLIRWSIDGEAFPSRIRLSAAKRLLVRAEAISHSPFNRVEIIVNGTAVANSKVSLGEIASASVEEEIELPRGGWIAIRCWGPTPPELYPYSPVFANTSPAFVEIEGQPIERDVDALSSLRTEVEGVRHWVETEGRFANAVRKERLRSLCDAALGRL